MNTYKSVFLRSMYIHSSHLCSFRLGSYNSFSTEVLDNSLKLMYCSNSNKNRFYQRHTKTITETLEKKLGNDILKKLSNILERNPSTYNVQKRCFTKCNPEDVNQKRSLTQWRADVEIKNGQLKLLPNPKFNSMLLDMLSNNEINIIESLLKFTWGSPFSKDLNGTVLIRRFTFDDIDFPSYCTGKHLDMDGDGMIMVMEVESENVDVETTIWKDSIEKTREGALLTLMGNLPHSVTITKKEKGKPAHRTVLVIRLYEVDN